jgi:hypothetical protein
VSNQDQYDLDEDIFCFEIIEQERAGGLDEDEGLEAIFATFQSEEDAAAAEAPSAAAEAEGEYNGSDMPDLAFQDDQVESAEQSAANSVAGVAPQASAPQASAPQVVPGQAASTFSKSALLILTSVTLLNGMVGFVTLRQSSNIMQNVNNTGSSLLQTADEIKRRTLESTRAQMQAGVPLAEWDIENHPVFDEASQDIDNHNFAGAIQKLHIFLRTIDGIDPVVREDMEARAMAMIASATQLKAIDMEVESDR